MKNKQLINPGIVQYSKVSSIIQSRKIHEIVNKKKLDANLKMQEWEKSIRINLRPKTTSYLQKMLVK